MDRINTGGVNVGNFLVETSLRGSDVLDATEKLFKIVKGLVRVLQPFVVEHEAFDNELPKLLCGPYAETSGNMAFDPVANGDDHVEVVVGETSLNLSGAFLTN